MTSGDTGDPVSCALTEQEVMGILQLGELWPVLLLTKIKTVFFNEDNKDEIKYK